MKGKGKVVIGTADMLDMLEGIGGGVVKMKAMLWAHKVGTLLEGLGFEVELGYMVEPNDIEPHWFMEFHGDKRDLKTLLDVLQVLKPVGECLDVDVDFETLQYWGLDRDYACYFER